MNPTNLKQLSAYTIAANCTDLRDIQCGIDEINEVIKELPDKNDKIPTQYTQRLQKLNEKKVKFEQHIFLVNSGEYTPMHMFRYAKTKDDAIKLAISLISESMGELIITKPPVAVEKYEIIEYYQFFAKIKSEGDHESKFEFCMQTLKVYDPN